MTSIIDIEGIGPVYKEKLAEAGVKTTEKLLEVAGAKSGREELAATIGVSEATVLEWVNRADLMRINGVGEEFSDLLEAAGVDSPLELAQRNAENLYEKLVEVNDAKNLVNRVPSAVELAKMIDDASSLPKVVTH